MEIIDVKTPSYEGKIYLGEDVIKERLPALTKGRKCFVVTDDNVYALYAEWFQQWFEGAEIYVLPAGEKNKNFQSLCDILEKMAAAGMRRNSRLFAVGGGVVGDIGGLAAALYMRGISYVQIPTTLLAQIDSSVGGKTAVDVCGIKNLVGAFYQPCEVLVNPAFLNTLPAREIKCGLGEMVKYAALCGISIAYFYRCFRKWSGKSPVEYRNLLRLSNAEAMLRNSDMRMGEIASLIGFDDPFYFCRVFAKQYGMSPRAYRNALAEKTVSLPVRL